ncbi:hypothetical protein ACVWXL_005854 [Bradyrhizobium sp. GM22.5]
MMRIKVTDDNLSKVWDALDRANGKAKAHVALPGDVFALAIKAEGSLSSRGLPARERAGAQVVWHGGGASAQAYRYKMARTCITLTRGAKEWFLTDVKRVGVYPRQGEHYRIRISPAQRDRIVATVLRTIEVRNVVSSAAPTAV